MSSTINGGIKGPTIANGDKTSLRKFLDQAARVLATLTSMDCLSEVNQGKIVQMLERLPRHVRDKFAQHAYDLEGKGKRFPTFAEFVKFVDKWAAIANHPINKHTEASLVSPSKARGMGHKTELIRPTTMAINDLFKSKTHQERTNLVRSKGLCWNCLRDTPVIRSDSSSRHFAAVCPSSFRCKVPGCGELHHTLLHPPGHRPEGTDSNVNQRDMQERSSGAPASHTRDLAPSCGTVNAEGPGVPPTLQPGDPATSCGATAADCVGTVILQVIGANESSVTTYAMLDSG